VNKGRSIAAALLLAAAASSGVAVAQTGDCSDLAPAAISAGPSASDLSAEDLLRMRDIGWPASAAPYGSPAIALSPDGKSVAFQLRRVAPDAKGYCLGLFLADAERGGTLLEIDRGGELLRDTYDRTGIAAFPSGVPKVITPLWSPDGKAIAFLKRTEGHAQIWIAQSDGSGSAPLTRSEFDIETLTWAADGRSIVFGGRPGLERQRRAIEAEGELGFHYDERFVPKASARPFPVAPVPFEYFSINLASRDIREAADSEIGLIDPARAADLPAGALQVARSDEGKLAWTAPKNSGNYIPLTELRMRVPGKEDRVCQQQACESIVSMWWAADDRSLRYLRREGWENSQVALYSWAPNVASPKRLFRTDAMLASCAPDRDIMICLRETSTTPSQIVRVDDRGAVYPLVDLNPEIRARRFGRTERLHWRNAFGIETFGDLVLPPAYDDKGKLPLVIVQYDSRGFLRGGTGDEYPIRALAAKGFAVLSFERPKHFAGRAPARNGDELYRNNLEGWADLRSVLSSLETGVDLLVARGVVDPARVGIGGLSDGTRNIQFALLNSDIFSVASVSSSFEDPGTLIPLAGAGADSYIASGYPEPHSADGEFWERYSIARNAARIRAPILMQMSDDEYLGSLEALRALRMAKVASALYVFPGERHVKWQPAHRLAVYKRNLSWFSYWLLDDRSPETLGMLPESFAPAR
jgi:dipeptidyl aminopeptidase/acylaminoacyl peptidase